MLNTRSFAISSLLAAALVAPAGAQTTTGPSSSRTPYVVPLAPGVTTTSILSVGDSVNNKPDGTPYRMVGIPDGLGAFDNGNGTFTLLMNHELGANAGVVRAHGSAGAFVSQWIINKSDLRVLNGSDLTKLNQVFLWNTTTNSFNLPGTTAFGRFCSGDLPALSAFYNEATGLGTTERIYMNGEESGTEGRAFAHIATGASAGQSWELPYLGKFSWENSVASPVASNKTIVAGLDDSGGGQVYFYIGDKTDTGTDIDKAGLNNGLLYGLAVSGLPAELNGSVPTAGTRFSLANLGNVANTTGAALETQSNGAGVTRFFRPEDGAWNPSNPNEFYFATTNSFTTPSRLWKLTFDDIANPLAGGIVEAVLDGTEGQRMLDNLAIDNHGNILLQEDVGNQAHNGKIWQYNIASDRLTLLAQHDPARFAPPTSPYTQDEESSGIIDMEEILGAGWFLLDVQAHYNINDTELVQGGQLLAMFNPSTAAAVPESSSVPMVFASGLLIAGLWAKRRQR
jgi:Bacterial protein of unknown function (DUF839)